MAKISEEKERRFTLEQLFFYGMVEQFYNCLESGAYWHKNIKDRSKIARRFANQFDNSLVYEYWLDNTGRSPDDEKATLLQLADDWEAERVARKEAAMLERASLFVAKTKKTKSRGI